jgi:hypothetical protein
MVYINIPIRFILANFIRSKGKTMEHKKLWFGIFVMVFVMAVIGCDTGNGNENENGNGNGNGNDGAELWEQLVAESGTWTHNTRGITLVFRWYETLPARGYANLKYTTTLTADINDNAYIKLNNATKWYLDRFDSPINISFEGKREDAGTITFTSDSAMTITGISDSPYSQYNGSYTRQ